MESSVIQSIAQLHNIPCLTLRIILDSAQDTLPLNFNLFYSTDGQLKLGSLVMHLLLHPQKIPSLLRFSSETKMAATQLAQALNLALTLLQGHSKESLFHSG